MLAKAGFDTEQNPAFAGEKNPDFRIEGRIFDNFAPSFNKTVRNIWSVVEDKVEAEQTRRVILNLDDSNISVQHLRQQFSSWRIEHLEEVIAVRENKIYRIFPEAEH